ncbi:hypothetical protein DKX38_010014 [Salix brachista]|uniref:CCHC-type domain-containing protein n=1 Tax=Salix brachista TaxID=2182728 RepID=A0A5N5MEH2_9ROSI|nr:hypothetical protein DKX38_010014 [Salix brachista]
MARMEAMIQQLVRGPLALPMRVPTTVQGWNLPLESPETDLMLTTVTMTREKKQQTRLKINCSDETNLNIGNASESAYKGKLTAIDVQSTPKVVPDQTSRGASSSNSPAGNRTTAVAKEAPRAPNTYAKTGGFKCYRCGQLGHRSNECPARRPVNFIGAGAYGEEGQYEGEETETEELLEGAEIAEEEGDFVNCVVQRVLARECPCLQLGRKIAMVPKQNSGGVANKATTEDHSLLSLVTSFPDLEEEVKEAREVHVVVV